MLPEGVLQELEKVDAEMNFVGCHPGGDGKCFQTVLVSVRER